MAEEIIGKEIERVKSEEILDVYGKLLMRYANIFNSSRCAWLFTTSL